MTAKITKHQTSITRQTSNTNITNTRHPFDLEQRTLAFAKGVIRACQSVPNNIANRELISQVVRASGSVGANYREANDASSKRDFSYRIGITQREAKEAHYWLQLLSEANPECQGGIEALVQEACELKKIFASIAGKSR